MTEQRLRDLMHESVADVSTTDFVDAAWERAAKTRRRYRIAIVGGAVAAVVAIVGTIALVDRLGTAPAPPVTTNSASPTPDGDRPDTTHQGVPVWWSPDSAGEEDLPGIEPGSSDLPSVIDLGASAPDVDAEPIDRALAAFAVFDDNGIERLVLLSPDGAYRTLDVSRLVKVAKPNGYRLDPEGESMLSADGRTLMFPQDGHVMLYMLATGEWRRIETGNHETAFATWSDGQMIYLPGTASGGEGPLIDLRGDVQGAAAVHPTIQGVPLASAQPYGNWRVVPPTGAESWSMGAGVPGPPGYSEDSEFMVVRPGLETMILAFPWRTGGDETRWLQCCPVAGWLDGNTVVYESRKAEPQLVAWTVGTHEFRNVATITGFAPGQESYVASWASMSQ